MRGHRQKYTPASTHVPATSGLFSFPHRLDQERPSKMHRPATTLVDPTPIDYVAQAHDLRISVNSLARRSGVDGNRILRGVRLTAEEKSALEQVLSSLKAAYRFESS